MFERWKFVGKMGWVIEFLKWSRVKIRNYYGLLEVVGYRSLFKCLLLIRKLWVVFKVVYFWFIYKFYMSIWFCFCFRKGGLMLIRIGIKSFLYGLGVNSILFESLIFFFEVCYVIVDFDWLCVFRWIERRGYNMFLFCKFYSRYNKGYIVGIWVLI